MNNYFASLIEFRKKIIEALKLVEFTILDDKVAHEQIIPNSTYSPWRKDEEFLKAYETVQPNTLVDIYRCYELWSFIKRNSQLEGDVLEIGVWRGGTGCLMAKSAEVYSPCNVYLVDTFEGVVKASHEDTKYRGGEHSDTSIEMVKDLIGLLKLKNITLLKGVFPEEVNLDKFVKKPLIKLCHIDVDTFTSAKDIFEYVWPHIVKGGSVIFDDYGFWGCEGVTKFCNDISLHDATFIYNLNGHAIFIKL